MESEKKKELEAMFGAADRRSLTKALHGCPVVQRVREEQSELVKELIDAGELLVLGGGAVLCQKGDRSDDVYFVLAGKVSILCKNSEVARRDAVELVGEMSLLRDSPERSATMKTLGATALWKVPGGAFEAIANKRPTVWRGIGLRLGNRLGEREWTAPDENLVPRVFFGSSNERKEVLGPLEAAMREHNVPFVAEHWNKSFRPGDMTLDRLIELSGEVDFAVMVFAADDWVTTPRASDVAAVRDNVIAEAMMFMATLGRARVIGLVPPEARPTLPSDFAGWTWLSLPDSPEGRAAAANEIAGVVRSLGARPRFPKDKPERLKKP